MLLFFSFLFLGLVVCALLGLSGFCLGAFGATLCFLGFVECFFCLFFVGVGALFQLLIKLCFFRVALNFICH